MTCEEVWRTIFNSNAAEVPRAVRAAVISHATACPACIQKRKDIRAKVELLIPEEIKQRVRQANLEMMARDMQDPEYRKTVMEGLQ